MKLDQINRWLSLLANVGVIAGIVFLAIEIRQNNENLTVQTRANYHATFSEIWGMAAENSELANILGKDLSGEQLTRSEFIQLAAYWTKSLLANQWSFLGLPIEESAPNLQYLKGSFDEFPTLRWVWEHRQDFFDARFADHINQNVVIDLADRSIPELPVQ